MSCSSSAFNKLADWTHLQSRIMKHCIPLGPLEVFQAVNIHKFYRIWLHKDNKCSFLTILRPAPAYDGQFRPAFCVIAVFRFTSVVLDINDRCLPGESYVFNLSPSRMAMVLPLERRTFLYPVTHGVTRSAASRKECRSVFDETVPAMWVRSIKQYQWRVVSLTRASTGSSLPKWSNKSWDIYAIHSNSTPIATKWR